MSNFQSRNNIYEAIVKFCVYRERCHSEVRKKLIDNKVYGEDLEKIMAKLISDNFLNEERYSRAYVRGKFRINGWGKIKIKNKLLFRRISPYCIDVAMKEIDENEYILKLSQTLKIKTNNKSVLNLLEKQKLIKFALAKGFEYLLILETINKEFEVIN